VTDERERGRDAAPDGPGVTCQRILQAAEAAFVAQGFHVTTMDAIAASVRCSKKTVYKLFASKDDLFRAVMERRREEVARLPVDPHQPPEQALRDFLLRLAEILLRDSSIALMRIAMAEAGRTSLLGPDWTKPRPETARLELEEYLAQLAAAGGHDFGAAPEAARMLVGMALGAFHHELMAGLEVSLPQEVLTGRIEHAVRIFLRGSRVEAAG
jgi:AcrR family transcriptional regulator